MERVTPPSHCWPFLHSPFDWYISPTLALLLFVFLFLSSLSVFLFSSDEFLVFSVGYDGEGRGGRGSLGDDISVFTPVKAMWKGGIRAIAAGPAHLMFLSGVCLCECRRVA